MSNWAEVVAIEPEIEAWLWTDSPHVAEAVGWPSDELFGPRDFLQQRGAWPAGASKPPDPKAALESVCMHTRTPRSAAIFRKVAQRASFKECTDSSFLDFCDYLRAWFPQEHSA